LWRQRLLLLLILFLLVLVHVVVLLLTVKIKWLAIPPKLERLFVQADPDVVLDPLYTSVA